MWPENTSQTTGSSVGSRRIQLAAFKSTEKKLVHSEALCLAGKLPGKSRV